jgi:hypothetical protein
LQMRFEAVVCLCERMECESRIIDEDIHFAVVALLNYEKLLRHFVKRVKILLLFMSAEVVSNSHST